jgi:integrase
VDWADNTLKARETIHRLHIAPTIGDLPTSVLMADREHLRRLYRRGTPALARNVSGALSAAYGWAISEEIVDRDPTTLVKPPVYRRPEARYLDLQDIARVRDLVIGTPLEGAVILGLAGLRAAEACYVTWRDLTDEGVLHVRGSTWGTTKTKRTRSLTLPAGEVAALRAYRTREAERLLAVGVRIGDRTTILTDAYGKPMKPANLGHAFSAFARAHGLDVVYHSLRHTSASVQLAAGVDVRTVAGRLGHANPTTTLARYSHLLTQADRDAAERIDTLLNRSRRSR